MARYIRPASEIRKERNFLMGYITGELRKWYCGIEGVYSVFNGYWNDPEIVYKGYAINEPLAIDGMYQEYYQETGRDDLDGFSRWLKDNKDTWLEDLDILIAAYEEEAAEAA